MEHENTEAVQRDAAALNLLMHAAEMAINDGLRFSRADDPHRLARLPREFDEGLARRRLVIDYLSHGRVRIAFELHGKQGGEDRAVAIFSTTLQGPLEPFEVKQ